MSDLMLSDGTELTEPRAAEFLDGFLKCVPPVYDLQKDLARSIHFASRGAGQTRAVGITRERLGI